jgi:hypothetical protein
MSLAEACYNSWLRARDILLPGVTTLARLVARVRDETTRQLWEELAALPDPVQGYPVL